MISKIFNNVFSFAAQILGHPLVCIPFSLFILISVMSSFCTVFFGLSSKFEESDDDLDQEPDDLDEEPDDLDEEPSLPDVDRRYTVKVKGYNRSLGSYSKR